MFRLYPRLKSMGLPAYQWSPDVIHIHRETLERPLGWRRPRMIFTNSMSDFFHERIPFEFLDKVLEVIRETPQHTYQILTKRSWRMMKYAETIERFPDNVWCGVSVESATYKFRIDHLRKVKARVRFVSVEPLIAPLGSIDLSEIHWVIVGGESGPNRRSFRKDWACDIRDQCLRANMPFFFKQIGGLRPSSGGRLLDGREWNQFPHNATLPVASH